MQQIRSVILVLALLWAGGAAAQQDWVVDPQYPVIYGSEMGDWCTGARYVEAVVKVGGVYHLFYSGTSIAFFVDHAIGHATSIDGITWEIDPNNPVMAPEFEGDWEVTSILSAAVIHDGTEFKMWYGGGEDMIFETGYATSPDGSNWTRHSGNPVFGRGAEGTFDDSWAMPAAVILENGVFHLWYNAAEVPAITDTGSIGHATSTDGVNWIRHPAPVVTTDPGWESFYVYGPGVVFDGTIYHMWYTGLEGTSPHVLTDIGIGYATSPDGINWTKDPGNPLDELIGDHVSQSVVVPEPLSHQWTMFYTREDDFSFLRATSECCLESPVPMWILPAAGYGAGAEGSFYVTDVDVSNPGTVSMTYRFGWLPRNQTNLEWTRSSDFTLGPGMTVRYENILAEVFGIAPDAYGALTIESTSEDFIAMGRIYATPSAKTAGTFGQSIPAVPLGSFIGPDDRRRVVFGTENADARFNVGCQNGGDDQLVVSIELIDSTGVTLQYRTLTLPPWGNRQINRIFNDFEPITGSIDVWTEEDGGRFYCYGSMLDNQTNDPTTVPPL